MLLVAGAAGFLGSSVLRAAERTGMEVAAVVHSASVRSDTLPVVSADLSVAGEAERVLAEIRPAWVINCAALTSVDECERNPVRARALNVELPANLAMACREGNVRLLHISTDSVFDGDRGMYSEDDLPSPVNAYARTKLEGEQEVSRVLPGTLIARTNFVGLARQRSAGLAGWIASSLEKGEAINGFTDVVFSPLLSDSLAAILFSMMERNLEGLYHVSARDSISKYDFAVELAGMLDLPGHLVRPAKLTESPLPAPRPLNTSLVPARAESALGIKLPGARDTIARFADLWRITDATTAGTLNG